VKCCAPSNTCSAAPRQPRAVLRPVDHDWSWMVRVGRGRVGAVRDALPSRHVEPALQPAKSDCHWPVLHALQPGDLLGRALSQFVHSVPHGQAQHGLRVQQLRRRGLLPPPAAHYQHHHHHYLSSFPVLLLNCLQHLVPGLRPAGEHLCDLQQRAV